MKSQLKKILLVSLSVALSILCNGQGKVYTRKAKLQDFPTKITRVVLVGNPVFDTVIKEEIASRWRISPYEFCTVAEYEKCKENTQYYFLRLVQDSDYVFMSVNKAGVVGDSDPLKQPFEVLSIPIAPAGDTFSPDLTFFPAFIDIVQQFINSAMLSDKVAYMGFGSIVSKKYHGKTIAWDLSDARDAFSSSAQGVLAALIVKSSAASAKPSCYKMVISCDSHELCYFRKQKLKAGQPAEFSDQEKKSISGSLL